MDADTLRRIEEALADRNAKIAGAHPSARLYEQRVYLNAHSALTQLLSDHADDLIAAAKRVEKYEALLLDIAADDSGYRERIHDVIAREALGPEE